VYTHEQVPIIKNLATAISDLWLDTSFDVIDTGL
jgi:hypothetical protein